MLDCLCNNSGAKSESKRTIASDAQSPEDPRAKMGGRLKELTFSLPSFKDRGGLDSSFTASVRLTVSIYCRNLVSRVSGHAVSSRCLLFFKRLLLRITAVK